MADPEPDNRTQRTAIRDAAKALLIAAATRAGDRVEASRKLSREEGKLPSLGIYTFNEKRAPKEKQPEERSPRMEMRQVDIEIQGVMVVSPDDELDVELDNFEEEICAAMDADPRLAGWAADSEWTTTMFDVREEGRKTLGIVKVTYEGFYRRMAPPAGEVDDLGKVEMTHDPDGADQPAAAAVDLVTGLDS